MANEGNTEDTNVLLSVNKNIHQDARSQMQLHDLNSEYIYYDNMVGRLFPQSFSQRAAIKVVKSIFIG